MQKFSKSLFASAAFAALAMAAPASAQVNGIATVDAATAIAASQARGSAYQQIATTYASQYEALRTGQQELSTLSKQLDTNNDNQVSDEELAAAQAAKNPVLQQIQAKQAQVATAEAPIVRAQLYALEQILAQYSPALQQVISDKNIGVILSPDAFIYYPQTADVTGAVIEVLNTRVPVVSAAAPADWQPQRATVNLRQQVQEVLVVAMLQQQQAQQQGQQPAAPAAQMPEGR